MSPHSERRIFSRVSFDATTYVIHDGKREAVTLLDISLNGALIEMPAQWHAENGSKATIEIILSPDITILMEAHLAHIETSHAGFRCDAIDIDSMTHLRRVVELNTGEPDLVEREFSALGL